MSTEVIEVLMGFEPKQPPSQEPAIDEATRRVTDALRNGTADLFPNTQIHCCGQWLYTRAVTVAARSGTPVHMIMCIVHMIASHREEALQFDPDLLHKVMLLPDPGAPTERELSGEYCNRLD